MSDIPVRPRFDPRRLHHWLAYAGGAGLLPRAPGTWGTLAAVPLYPLLAGLPLAGYLALLVLLFAVGVWACGRTGRELGVHDHGAIVWDEVVGFLVTMTALPASWPWLLAGFLLFRVFDILKPWPIGWLDRRVDGGLGVMLDDVLAGLMALALLHLIPAAWG
jgi:phosphatidylglycerophosphatase A